MALTQVFLGFLQPVAIGSGTILILLFLLGLKTPRRTPATIARRTQR
jgi:hypothetical protein